MGWALNLVIFSAWFPRKGKGFFLGLWTANATFGDLVGTQIYKATAQESKNWFVSFYIVSAMVMTMAIVNYFFLVERPGDVGILIADDEAGGNEEQTSMHEQDSTENSESRGPSE